MWEHAERSLATCTGQTGGLHQSVAAPLEESRVVVLAVDAEIFPVMILESSIIFAFSLS